MPDMPVNNGSLLLHTDPTNPASKLSVARTDVSTSVALAEIGLAGGGVSTLEGIITFSTTNSGLTNGPLVERFRVHTNGNVGIGVAAPTQALEVSGIVKGTAFQGNGAGLTAVNDTTKVSKTGDTMTGSLTVQGRLEVTTAAIVPAVGNTEQAGVMFPKNFGGGAGDAAWIRYFPRTGEAMTLQIGIANDPDDHISLMPSGNVGIGTVSPLNKLDVAGDVAISGRHALRGNDSWLRLNQDGAFVSGVHTPGVFAPNSLNVGGVGGWGNPGAGNMWIAGDLRMEAGHTISSQGRLHISGEEILYLLNKSGVVVSKAWGGNGNLSVEGQVQVSGELGVNGVARASSGVLAINIGLGTQIYGATSYPYETIQMHPSHNLRLWYGTKERVVFGNDGSILLRFDQGYWAFQGDGNLVKYRNDGTAIWALNKVSGNWAW